MPTNSLQDQGSLTNQKAAMSSFYTPEGGFDYDAFQSKLNEMSEGASTVFSPQLPEKASILDLYSPWTAKWGTMATTAEKNKQLIEGAYSQYGAQQQAMQGQADRAGAALQLKGEVFMDYMRNLDRIQADTTQKLESAQAQWGSAAEKAEQYVGDATARKYELLNRIDTLTEQMGKDLEFEKANAMQASVQAAVGAMRQEEKGILQMYGADSPEYHQFQARKGQTMAAIQSNVRNVYAQLREQQRVTALNATTEAGVKSDMYVNFQEQMHVETLKWMESVNQQFALQAAQFELTVEQMRMQGMDEIANWMVETPAFVMDLGPIMSLLTELTPVPSSKSMEMVRMTQASMYGNSMQNPSWGGNTKSSGSGKSTTGDARKAESSKGTSTPDYATAMQGTPFETAFGYGAAGSAFA